MTTTVLAKNEMLDALALNKIRLHSGATTDGTQNVVLLDDNTTSAETAASWGAASNAERDLSGPVSIEGLAASSTVSHFSFWQGATYKGSAPVTSVETYNAAGGTSNITSAKFTLSDVAV